MPAYGRAELSAEFKVVPSNKAEKPPREQVEAARRAAGETGIAREAGPDTTLLAGGRREVLDATVRVLDVAVAVIAVGRLLVQLARNGRRAYLTMNILFDSVRTVTLEPPPVLCNT